MFKLVIGGLSHTYLLIWYSPWILYPVKLRACLKSSAHKSRVSKDHIPWSAFLLKHQKEICSRKVFKNFKLNLQCLTSLHHWSCVLHWLILKIDTLTIHNSVTQSWELKTHTFFIQRAGSHKNMCTLLKGRLYWTSDLYEVNHLHCTVFLWQEDMLRVLTVKAERLSFY